MRTFISCKEVCLKCILSCVIFLRFVFGFQYCPWCRELILSESLDYVTVKLYGSCFCYYNEWLSCFFFSCSLLELHIIFSNIIWQNISFQSSTPNGVVHTGYILFFGISNNDRPLQMVYYSKADFD